MHDHDDDTSWRDDLRVELAHEFLSEIFGAAAVAEVEMPHIVVCRDDEVGSVTYSGPFPDGVTALVFAERESAVDRALDPDSPLTFGVAALYPGDTPSCSADPAPRATGELKQWGHG